MKKIANILLVVAAISFLLGIISRFTLIPIPFGMGIVEARGIMFFTNTCLIFVIALAALQIANKK